MSLVLFHFLFNLLLLIVITPN